MDLFGLSRGRIWTFCRLVRYICIYEEILANLYVIHSHTYPTLNPASYLQSCQRKSKKGINIGANVTSLAMICRTMAPVFSIPCRTKQDTIRQLDGSEMDDEGGTSSWLQLLKMVARSQYARKLDRWRVSQSEKKMNHSHHENVH